MCRSTWPRTVVLAVLGTCCGARTVMGQAPTSVHRAVLGEPNQPTAAVSTDELRRILAERTAFVFDARSHREFAISHIPGALNVAAKPGGDVGEVKRAKDDGRLPMEDHNTRIVVFGEDAGTAHYVAEALAREASHNVSYLGGTFQQARAALQP